MSTVLWIPAFAGMTSRRATPGAKRSTVCSSSHRSIVGTPRCGVWWATRVRPNLECASLLALRSERTCSRHHFSAQTGGGDRAVASYRTPHGGRGGTRPSRRGANGSPLPFTRQVLACWAGDAPPGRLYERSRDATRKLYRALRSGFVLANGRICGAFSHGNQDR